LYCIVIRKASINFLPIVVLSLLFVVLGADLMHLLQMGYAGGGNKSLHGLLRRFTPRNDGGGDEINNDY
jgi:hypothetical protein